MQLRQLEYLLILAREKHFGRAAQTCAISQSALSQALRNFEQEFGVPIVDRRNQGFRGFTPEGLRILDWARGVLADHSTLLQQIGGGDPATLSGHIQIGVIPMATPMVSLLTKPFQERYPAVTVSLLSRTSDVVVRELERFEIQAAITYLDGTQRPGVRPYDLYEESYYLLAPEGHPLAERDSVTWKEAGALPLCLLSPGMLNRMLLDDIFASAGVTPKVVIDTDCAVVLCSHVRTGTWFTVVPHSFFYLIGGWQGTKAIPLVEPVAKNTMGLLIAERHPLPPVVAAFAEAVQAVDVASELKRYVP